jgi:hypothetical protein
MVCLEIGCAAITERSRVKMKVRGPEIAIIVVLVGLVVLLGYAYVVTRPPREPQVEPPISFEAPPEEPSSVVPAEGAPAVEISELTHDFGTIEPDQVVDYTFTVTNTGDAELKIEGLRTSCGCLTLEPSALEIPPEETAELVAELNPQHYGGPSPNISAYVYTNDPRHKLTVLTISAKITPEFVVEPQTIDFGTVAKGAGSSRTVHLRQTWREPVEITKLETSSEAIAAFYSEVAQSDESGSGSSKKEYEVEVRLEPDAPGGNLAGYVTLFTNVNRVPMVRIPVRAFVRGGVSVVPEVFLFAAREPGEDLGTIDVYSEAPFGVGEIESDIEGIEWKSRTTGLRPAHSIGAGLKPGAKPGSRSGSVTIELQRAGLEEIVVPVAGVVLEGKQE